MKVKKLFLLLTLAIGFVSAFAQSDDSTKYIWYKYQYGFRQPRIQSDSVLTVPRDTAHNAKYGSLAVKKDTLYFKDSTKWVPASSDLSQIPFLSIGKKTTYDTTGKVYFSGGHASEVKLKPIKLTPRFGAELINNTDDTSIAYVHTPYVVGVKSAADLRTLTTLATTDTQFVFRLTNYTLGYIQDYQYDPNDASSTDNGATIIVAGTKRFRAIFPSGMVNVKIFGARGDNSTDDHDAIQAACDALVANSTLPRNLYFPQGAYRITKPIIIYKWDGANYQQCQVNLIGQEFQHWNDITTVARIRFTDTASFAIGIQQGRSMVIKGLSIEGPFIPPWSGDYIAYYKVPFANWANGSMRDKPQSPGCGINIDPFTNSGSQMPADGGYAAFTSWYRGGGGGQGASGIHVEQCRIFGFTVGIGISLNSWTQNGENMVFRDNAITQCKAAYASGQLQTKANFIYNGISDDRVFAIVSGDYGNGHGQQPYIMGYNIAGTVISVCHGMSNQFPLSFQNIFAEGLYQIGDGQTGAGAMEFVNCNLDFALYTTPYPIPPYHWKGDNVKFEGCTLRYYDDSLNRRLYFNGSNIIFNNCWFDKPPYGKMQVGISSSLPIFSFNECRTGNTELIGWKTLTGSIVNTQYKIVKYGHVHVSDAGAPANFDAGVRSVDIDFNFGELQRLAGIGSVAVTIDTTIRQGTFSVATGTASLLAVGDYVLYGPAHDTALGKIKSVNYSTGAIVLMDIPVGVKSATFDMYATYYEIARGYLIGHTLNGSNVIDSVKYGNWFGQPVVGDRAGIGFREAVITQVNSTDIHLSTNAYYTRSQDYRSLDQSEKITFTSYYDLSHANLDGYALVVPQNAIWKILQSPYTNNQHTYYFSKGGYIHMSTVSGPPTYWQAEWRLTADNNTGAINVFEGENVRIGTGADNGKKFQVNGISEFDGVIKATGMKTGVSQKILTHETDSTIAQMTIPVLTYGTYTPTLTNATNVASSTAFQCQYSQVGNIIHVSGKVSITPTAGSANTVLGISLPVASGFSSTGDAGGAGFDGTTVGFAALANTGSSRVDFQFTSNGTGARTYWFTFTYYLTPP